jgi:hypothetical protein
MRLAILLWVVMLMPLETDADERKAEQGYEVQETTEIELGHVSAMGGDALVECEVSPPVSPLFYYTGFILGEEWFLAFQDPVAAGCSPGYPFGVTTAEFTFCVEEPCTTSFSIQLYDADISDLACPIPAYVLQTSNPLKLQFPGANCYSVSVTFPDTFCVFNPYFVAINLYEPVSCLGIVVDTFSAACQDYNFYNGELVDMNDYGIPGKMALYTKGVSSSEVDCTLPPPNVEISFPDDGSCFGDSVEIRAVDWNESPYVYQVDFQYNDGRAWITFATDFDGTSCYGYTFGDSIPCQDGWSAKFDTGPLLPGLYQFRVIFYDEVYGQFTDEISLFHPEFSHDIRIVYPPPSNSVLFGCNDGCTVQVESENPEPPPGQPQVDVKSEPKDYDRGVPELSQFDALDGHNILVPDEDDDELTHVYNNGCTPTAFASCLKWLANHDDNNKCIIQKRDANGDPIPDEYLTDEELAESLWTAFGTKAGTKKDPFGKGTGTDYNKVKPALEKWFKRKCGNDKFTIQDLYGKNDLKIDRYIEELKKQDEDVVLGRDGHTVTANSYRIVTENNQEKKKIDIMDPAKSADENPVEMEWPSGNDKYIRMWVISPKETAKSAGAEQASLLSQSETDEGKLIYEFLIDPGMLYPDSITVISVSMEDANGCSDKDVVIVGPFTGCVPGDADGSGEVDIDDVVYLISYIFAGGMPPMPTDCCGDADGIGTVDIDDVVHLIGYIFSGGPPPVDAC